MVKGYSFDPDKHVHTFGGKRMYGVTSVLSFFGDKSGLIDWAAKQAVEYIRENSEEAVKGLFYVTEDNLEEAKTAHHKKRDKAGDKGTEIHGQLEVAMNQWIERGMTGDHENDIVNKVMMWMFDNGIKPLKSEMPVYHTELFYAGIADGVIEKDGKKYILDFKCGSGIYTTAFFQMGAYSLAIKHMKPDAEIAGCVVVHIPKGESFIPEKNVYWRYDIEVLEQGFANILSTYKTDKELEKLISWNNYSSKTSIKI